MSKKKANAAQMRHQVKKQVTDAIIEALEKGDVPWVKPWEGGESYMPHSTQGRPYRGINVLWLMLQPYASTQWGTFAAWRKEGAKRNKATGKEDYFGVKKGEKAVPVIYYKRLLVDDKNGEIDPETGKIKKQGIPLMKVFSVFNRDQTNLPPINVPKDERPIEEREEKVMSLIENNGIDYREGGNRALFNHALDYIQVPHRAHFKSIHGRMATILHEATHWTGHAARLNRDLSGTMGTEEYAREELIAEIGAALLCATIGVENTHLEENVDNHAAYIRHWLGALKGDGGSALLFKAAAAAQGAADLLLGYEYEEEKK